MIDKSFGNYVLICDICQEESEERFDTFQNAVDGKKELGWKSQKTNKGWQDVCTNCKQEY